MDTPPVYVIGAGPSGDSILSPDAGIIGVIVEAADPLTGGVDGRTGATAAATNQADLNRGATLGMDAARRGYYAVYGGSPGLTYLLDGFSMSMEERGLDAAIRRQLFVDDPARLFAVAPRN